MAISVDGYIALNNDETPWSDTSWNAYIAKVDEVGCLIIGRRTYEIMGVDGFKIFSNLKKIYVVTSSHIEAGDLVSPVSSPEEALKIASEDGFKVALLSGGTQLNQSAIASGIVDEIQLDIEPIILGSGIKLFEEVVQTKKLKHIATKQLDEGVIHIEYEVIK
jgi:dihydrofolate reductase